MTAKKRSLLSAVPIGRNNHILDPSAIVFEIRTMYEMNKVRKSVEYLRVLILEEFR